MRIFIVTGTTGEYSDRTEWLVTAFLNEERAKELVVLASARARQIQLDYKDDYWDLPGDISDYDPKFTMDYTGTSYYYTKTEIADWTAEEKK